MSAIKSPVRLHRWTFFEERALVEFVGLASIDAIVFLRDYNQGYFVVVVF